MGRPDDDAARREVLRAMMSEHLATPFPTSVEKGEDYGLVEPVMVDADIYGWCDSVAHSSLVPGLHVQALRALRDDLVQSLDAFPDQARPYFARLVEMATVALGE